MSRPHEHLNFPAETFGAERSGFYREARVFIHAPFRSGQPQKVRGCLTRARVDPEFSLLLYPSQPEALLLRITRFDRHTPQARNSCPDGRFATLLY